VSLNYERQRASRALKLLFPPWIVRKLEGGWRRLNTLVDGPIVTVEKGIQTLLKAGVTAVGNRVYIPGNTISSMMPRITISMLTPVERYAGLGLANSTTPTWREFTVKLDIWSKKMSDCDTVADTLINYLDQNKTYTPTGGDGFWMMLRLTGGSATVLNEPSQIWNRSVNFSGKFMQTS